MAQDGNVNCVIYFINFILLTNGHGLDIVKSGGRFIVAYEDFDLKQVDDYKLPVFEVYPSDDGLEQYDLFGLRPFNQTTEIIYVRGES